MIRVSLGITYRHELLSIYTSLLLLIVLRKASAKEGGFFPGSLIYLASESIPL